MEKINNFDNLVKYVKQAKKHFSILDKDVLVSLIDCNGVEIPFIFFFGMEFYPSNRVYYCKNNNTSVKQYKECSVENMHRIIEAFLDLYRI